MLIDFKVSNYRSIRDEIELSMEAVKADKSLQQNVLESGWGNLLSTSVIMGPNASGKSNVLKALSFLRSLVINSHNHQLGQEINIFPFLFDEASRDLPITYHVDFINGGTRFVYDLRLTRNRVLFEKLIHYPKRQPSLLFERGETRDDDHFTKSVRRQKQIVDSTLDNQLYLSKATQMNLDLVKGAFQWFAQGTSVFEPTDAMNVPFMELRGPIMKRETITALKKADFGIVDYRIEEGAIDLKRVPPEMIPMIVSGSQEMPPKAFNMASTHRIEDVDGTHRDYSLDVSLESMGTKAFIPAAVTIIDALRHGRLLIIDELEVRLHPDLVIWLIRAFMDPSQNKRGAQLLFTSHNPTLLDLDLLRRDQIWFTERDHRDGVTRLYSLAEFGERNTADVRSRYLTGRYGALPFLDSRGLIEEGGETTD